MRKCLAAAGLFLLYLVWQRWELTKFRVKEYPVSSGKIKEEARVAVIADLHGYTYGKGNRRLLEQVRGIKPQAILIPGDLIVSKYADTFSAAQDLLEELVKIAPVYYSFGNHETRLREKKKIDHPAFLRYVETAEKMGVRFLNNETEKIRLGENQVALAGLELPLSYYERGKIIPLEKGCLEGLLGRAGEEFTLLLAHNPNYAPEYAGWGADLTLCGHNHGGLVRIPGIGSLFSPQFALFPTYDSGAFVFGRRRVIVSRGLGTHTFHIRIFNRAELLYIRLVPDNKL